MLLKQQDMVFTKTVSESNVAQTARDGIYKQCVNPMLLKQQEMVFTKTV